MPPSFAALLLFFFVALQQLVQNQIAATVSHSFTSVQAGVHQTIQKMLFDGVSNENLIFYCLFILPFHHSNLQKLSNTISSSLSISLQQTIQSSYEAVFKAVVLPSFERSLQEMFQQVNEAFRKGTSECKCMILHTPL